MRRIHANRTRREKRKPEVKNAKKTVLGHEGDENLKRTDTHPGE